MAHMSDDSKVLLVLKADGEEGRSICRRNGNHHPNLWIDDFIQSISSPYRVSEFGGKLQTLIKEIKDYDMFNIQSVSMGMLERLWFVDILQRLGIDRHFEKEIKVALDFTYKCWTQEVTDLNITALGFRILRLHGYHVSADIFKNFKDGNGQFSCSSVEEDGELRTMLNLYRASELSFPEEKIMNEVKAFAYEHLKQALHGNMKLKEKKQFLMEVEYIFKYPWRCSVPRWEAWNFIDIYRQDNAWMEKNGSASKIQEACGKKLLEVAILDFNILQAQHHDEMKLISRWWKETNLGQLSFVRHRPLEYYFLPVSGNFEPDFSASRIGFAKICSMVTLIDDIYDTHGTLDELKPFTTALIRWDKSMLDSLPEYMRISFEFAYRTLEDIAIEAEKKHGPRVRKYMQNYWERYILSNLKDAEWIATNYIPTLDEYLENGVISVGVPMVTMHSLILLETTLSDDILERVNRFETLIARASRLVDDSKDFEDEKKRGEHASSIECYVKDNPGCTREEALNHINTLIDSTMQKLLWEFTEADEQEIPICCKKIYLTGMIRPLLFLYKDADGVTTSDKETRDAISKILVKCIGM